MRRTTSLQQRRSLVLLLALALTLLPPATPTPSAAAAPVPVAPGVASTPRLPVSSLLAAPPSSFVPRSVQAASLLPPAAPLTSVLAQLTSPETPISQGKPVSASSSDPDFPASNANDGDPETSWYSDYAQGLPQWWQVDFGEPYTITKVLIDWDYYRLDFLDYSLAVSDDGVTFTDVVQRSRTGATNSAEQTVETFTAHGRYLRLTVTDGWYDCSGSCTIDELRVNEFQAYNVPVVPNDQLNPPERCPCNAQDQTNNPVNTHTGAFWTSYTDLELASPGPNLAWSRTYNSRNITETTLLGPGWQHAYAARLITTAMPEGEDGFAVIVTPKGNRFRFAENGDGTFTSLPGIYDSLSQGSGVYTQTLRDQSQYVFSATTGRLITIRDPQGRTLTLSYDPLDGRLREIADALAPARKLVLGYNPAGDRITSVSDGARIVSYAFDGEGDLTTVTDVMGRPTTYEYWQHRITAILDSFGETVESMQYELQLGDWRVTYQQLQDGRQLWFAYSAEATTITIRSASWDLLEEQVIHYGPDSTKTGNSVNDITVRGSDYDEQFAPGVTIDGNGNPTTSDYNDAGQPLSITNALGQTTEAAYDALNRPVVITDTLGRRTEMAYDAANNLISQTTGITATFPGFTTVYTYNVRYLGKNWLEETVSPDGVRTRYEYDALGQRTAVTQNYVDGAFSPSAPDEDLRTTYGYDPFGRVVTTTIGVGTALQRSDVTEYNLDNTTARTIQNYVDGVYDSNAPDEDLITSYGYDDLGRQVWVRDALGRSDVTHYNLDGQVDWTAQNLVPFQVDTHNLPLFQPFSPLEPDRNVATLYAYDQLGRTSLITQTGILTGTFDPATRTFSSATTRTTRTEYDDLSRPITVTLNYRPGVPAGPDVNVQTLRQYDTAGNLVWERDALGRWVHTVYDALNRPVTVTVNVENGDPLTIDAANASWATLSDTDLVQVTAYREDGRVDYTIDTYVDGVFSSAEPDQDRKTVFVYDALGRQTQTIRNYEDGNPNTGGTDTDLLSETVYDAVGRVQATRDPLGQYNSQVYDGLGRVVATVQNCRDGSGAPVPTDCAAFDPSVPDRNVPATTRYDGLGRPFEMEDALGHVVRSEYDGLGRVVESTRNYVNGGPSDSDTNVSTSQTYDILGRVTASTDPLGISTSASYDALGRTIATSDGEQRVREMGYDGSGGARWSTTPDSRLTVTLVDGLGRTTATVQNYVDGLVGVNEPADQDLITRTVYDVAGRTVATIDPAGFETRFGYDLRDNLRSVTENAVDGPCVVQPCNVLTSYGYDRAGNRISVTDANTQTRTFAYDAANRQVASTDVLNQITAYQYDRRGRTTRKDDPRGVGYDVTYSYDELDRPTGMQAPELDAPISVEYNALGWRTSLADGTGTTSFAHDDLGRVTDLTAPETGHVGYGYNARGERTQLVYPDNGIIDYRYWDDGQLQAVEQGNETLAAYTYDPAGRLTALSQANGAVTTYGYDGADRLRDLATDHAGTALSHFTYEVDRRGLRWRVTEMLRDPVAPPAPTGTATPTDTATPTNTATRTATATSTSTTASATETATASATETATASATETATASATETATPTPVNTTTGASGGASVAATSDDSGIFFSAPVVPPGESGSENVRFAPAAQGGTCPDTYEPNNTAGAAKPIAVGETQDHAFCVAGDQDWASFQGVAGAKYQLRTFNSISGADTYLYLYSTDGVTELTSNDDSGGNLSSLIEYVLPQNGTYYLMVRHFSSDVGGNTLTYQVRVSNLSMATPTPTAAPCLDTYEPDNNSSQARPIAIGETQTHYLCVANDKDWVRFEVVAGGTYRIETLNLSAGTDTWLYLYDSNVNWLRDDNNSNGGYASRIDYTFSQGGTYYAAVDHYSYAGNLSYRYDLRITALSVPTPTATATATATPTSTPTATATATATATPTTEPGTTRRTITYTYDGLARLTEASYSTGEEYGYAYDLAGNRTEAWENGVQVQDRSYNAANQVVGWSYDAAGNLLSDGTTTSTYDALSRLTSQAGTSYAYNGDGTLVAQTAGGSTTRYAQDLVAPLSQVLNDGSASYVYGNGAERLRALNGPWYLGDALGSVRATLDEVGIMTAVASYDPWGVPQDGLIASFGFTGELQDAQGMVHLRARWYNPGSGTFTARDIFGGIQELPYSLHPYAYTFADPISKVDPSGLLPSMPCIVSSLCDDIASMAAVYGPVGLAVMLYSKDTWGCASRLDDGISDMDDIGDLWIDYVCEFGPDERVFGQDAELTNELQHTVLISGLRRAFYAEGGQSLISNNSSQMGFGAFFDAKVVDLFLTGQFITITDFLGGLDSYSVTKQTKANGETVTKFEIFNRTTLASGTRIGFTDSRKRNLSLAEYAARPSQYNRDGSNAVDLRRINSDLWNIITVLSEKNARDPKVTSGLGGGTMSQRFIWEEPYDECYEPLPMMPPMPHFPLVTTM